MPGILHFDLGDDSSIDSNSFIHTYTTGPYPHTVIVKQGSTNSVADITSINMQSDNLVGTLDVSGFSKLSSLSVPTNKKLQEIILPTTTTAATFGLAANDCCIGPIIDASSLTNLSSFQVYNNKQLTTVYNPPSSNVINAYYAFNCGLAGTLDCSGLQLQGNVRLESNSNLQNVLFNSPQSITYFTLNSCDLTGTLDLSKLTGLGGTVNLSNNPNLTQVLNPSSNTSFAGGSYNLVGCDITGTLDVSGYHNLGGFFTVNGNTNLNYIINPTSSAVFGNYVAYSCGLIGTLDLSGLSNFGGQFLCHTNPSLNTIINPDSSQLINIYWAYSCGLDGTLDLSGLSGFGGSVQLQYNPSLNTIINPSSSHTFSMYHFYNCNLIGELDVSGLVNLGGAFYGVNNINLQSIILPETFNKEFTQFRVANCSLNTTTIDDVLDKLNTWFTAHLPTSNGLYQFDGAKSAWPTDGSSNSNIINIKNIFDNSTAYTATFSVNDPI